MSTKDGNRSYGDFATDWNEKTTHPPSKEEIDKLNAENEWLKHLEGRGNRGQKAVRSSRLPSRIVSRSQRGAVVGETDGPSGREKSRAQRKVVKSG